MTLAIVSALADEQNGFRAALRDARQVRRAQRDFHVGQWQSQPVVLALSGIGKVAAASTASTLIEAFDVRRMVLTGVAGGLDPSVQVGDTVIASDFLQHDLDASPLFERYVVPHYGCKTLACDLALSDLLALAVQRAGEISPSRAASHRGLIVSGDRFIGDAQIALQLRQDISSAGYRPLAVEMEGAALAQVCRDHGVPFAAMRTISDRADETAHVDFQTFVQSVAGPRALAVLRQLMALL